MRARLVEKLIPKVMPTAGETPEEQRAKLAEQLDEHRLVELLGEETARGLEATREKVIVVMVDTGRARPGVFWASIPYNRIDLNEGLDQAYASLQVND